MKLRLFYFPSCYFCSRVLKEIKNLGLQNSIELCDTQATLEFHQELLTKTGRQTVPCLFIDDKPMHESEDIINWLRLNYGKRHGVS